MHTDIMSTRMGQIQIGYDEYCIGCPRFDPTIKSVLEADGNGDYVISLMKITCKYAYTCQQIAYQTANRIKDINHPCDKYTEGHKSIHQGHCSLCNPANTVRCQGDINECEMKGKRNDL